MLTKKKLFSIWFIGVISGFGLMISGNTLNYWLAKENIDIRTISLFAFVSIPYAINFFWAPLFDLVRIPFLATVLGQRLSWICVIQISLAISVWMLSKLAAREDTLMFALLCLTVAFLSSAQDTVLGALRIEIIPLSKQGAAAGIYIFGYRIGMLLSSSGAIYLSSYLSWNKIYELFAWVILMFPLLLIFTVKNKSLINKNVTAAPYKQTETNNDRGGVLRFLDSLLKPIGSYGFLIAVISFLALYRLPDNMLNIMLNPFLLYLKFDAYEIASIGKLLGIITAMLGGFIASWIMKKQPITTSLLRFGILHAVAHSLFIIQEIYGKNLCLLFIVIGIESITGGMSMAAYIAFIGSLCQGKLRATQYSFFSAMMGVSRSTIPAISGYIVIEFGWQRFFLFTTLAALPSLLLLYMLIFKYKR